MASPEDGLGIGSGEGGVTAEDELRVVSELEYAKIAFMAALERGDAEASIKEADNLLELYKQQKSQLDAHAAVVNRRHSESGNSFTHLHSSFLQSCIKTIEFAEGRLKVEFIPRLKGITISEPQDTDVIISENTGISAEYELILSLVTQESKIAFMAALERGDAEASIKEADNLLELYKQQKSQLDAHAAVVNRRHSESGNSFTHLHSSFLQRIIGMIKKDTEMLEAFILRLKNLGEPK